MNRSKLLLIAAGMLVILGLLLNLVFRSTPEPREVLPIEQSGFAPLSQAITVVYEGPQINLPDRLPAYEAEIETVDEIVQFFAETLDLKLLGEISWINEETKHSMLITTNAVQVSFDVPMVRNPGFENPDLAIYAANTFLNELKLNSRIIDEKNPHWLAPQAEAVIVENYENAGYVEFPLLQKTPEGYPIYRGSLSSSAQRVLVNNANEVVKITLQPEIIATKPTQIYDVITLDEALTQLKSGNNIVLSLLSSETFEAINTQEVNQVNLKNAQLQYRLDPINKVLYPFLSFTGTAALRDNTLIDQVEVIVKATK